MFNKYYNYRVGSFHSIEYTKIPIVSMRLSYPISNHKMYSISPLDRHGTHIGYVLMSSNALMHSGMDYTNSCNSWRGSSVFGLQTIKHCVQEGELLVVIVSKINNSQIKK